MKKAVIVLGGKQHLVAEGTILDVENLGETKNLKLEPLLVIDGESVLIGRPSLKKPLVSAEVIEAVKGDKVVSIRFKAKKRVEKRRGHRQKLSRIRISSIA